MRHFCHCRGSKRKEDLNLLYVLHVASGGESVGQLALTLRALFLSQLLTSIRIRMVLQALAPS